MATHETSSVLIVDDSEINRQIIKSILEPLGLDLHEAESGIEALSLVEKVRFSVILLDIIMPNINGYEIAKAINCKETSRHIPIVMISALSQEKNLAIKAYQSGAIDYLTKPVEPIILQTKVRQLVTIDRQKRAAELTQKKLEILLDHAGEGVVGINPLGTVTFANPMACKILKTTPSALINQQLTALIKADVEPLHLTHATDLVETFPRETSGLDVPKQALPTGYWYRTDGSSFCAEYNLQPIYDETDSIKGSVILFKDITERRQSEKRLVKLANFDALTNLANRPHFFNAMSRSMARAKRTREKFAVLILDLDHFKYVNDHLGHAAGDELLRTISDILVSCVRESDLVARRGGDEFAILLHDIRSSADPAKVAQAINERVRQPIEIFGTTIHTSASIGIAIYNSRYQTVDDLINAADTAMYESKRNGRNKFQFFARDIQKKADEKRHVKSLLNHAIEHNEFQLVYQPTIDINSGDTVAVEALLRWPQRDPIHSQPANFIPIAEESGQIVAIGDWVLEEALSQAAKWRDNNHLEAFKIAINVSAKQLRTGQFSKQVQTMLSKYHIEPEQLQLELSETGVIPNLYHLHYELNNLHKMGVLISLDNFGTGNSSLDHLHRLPLASIKIDRKFIHDLDKNPDNEELVHAAIALSRAMGFQVIADGVETKEQFNYLRDMHCDLMKGYYLSRPQQATDIARTIRQTPFR